MLIRWNGGHAVDIAGHDRVLPGDVVDVDDATAAGLLFAGSQVLADGTVIPPDVPLWTAEAAPQTPSKRPKGKADPIPAGDTAGDTEADQADSEEN